MPIKIQAWVLWTFFLLTLYTEGYCFVITKFPNISLFIIPIFFITKILALIIVIYCRPSQLTKGENNGISI